MRYVVTHTGKYRHIEDPKYPGWTLCSRRVRLREVRGTDAQADVRTSLELGVGIPVDAEVGAPDCSHCELKAKRQLGYE